METKILSIHFNAGEKLQAFIEKKMEKLNKSAEEGSLAEVVLKVDKPETVNNKITSIKLTIKGTALFVEKQSNTFEDGIELCIDAMLRQLTKYKEKQREK